MLIRPRLGSSARGQTLVETALVLPLFLMVLIGIVVLGIGIFYQQQVTNAAREAARFASIHSATAQCPVVSHRDPDPEPMGYYRCDPPQWPAMSSHSREFVFGLNPSDVQISACWSGYWTKDSNGDWSDYDAPPNDPEAPVPTFFRQCTIGGIDPTTDLGALSCPPPPTVPGDDMASNLSESGGTSANQVTAYACYQWQPPMAGFLLIPSSVTLRATVTEAMEYQQ